MEQWMEGHVRRIAGWSAWQRWMLLLACNAAFVGAFLLAARAHEPLVRVPALVVALALLPIMGQLGRATCYGDAPRKVDRRYMRQFTPAMAAYLLIMMFLWPRLGQTDQAWLRGLIALAPAVPIAWLILAMVRYVLGSDEFMQRLHLQALATAAGVVGFASIVAGFLVAAKLWVLDGSVLMMVYPALCLVYAVAFFRAKRRYRD
jgi:hypothetical protein